MPDHAHPGCPTLRQDGLQRRIGAFAQSVVGLIGDHVGQLIDDQQHERLTRRRAPLADTLLTEGFGALASEGSDVFQQLDGLSAVVAHQFLKQPRCAPSSMPPLGSIPNTCTSPHRIHGASARSTAHITDDFPASLTPATRMCRSNRRSIHCVPASVRPMSTRARSTPVPGSASGGAAKGTARGSAWIRSSQIRRGRLTRSFLILNVCGPFELGICC